MICLEWVGSQGEDPVETTCTSRMEVWITDLLHFGEIRVFNGASISASILENIRQLINMLLLLCIGHQDL